LFSPARRSPPLREKWHVSDRRPALLYVGRVSREKGLLLLPAISDRLYKPGIKHRCIVVGDGPLLPTLRDALPEAVFTGALSRQAVAEAFASADCFVFPSTTDTAGNVVLEAQASGLPVIVSGSGGLTTRCCCCVWFSRRSGDKAVKSRHASISIEADAPTRQGYRVVITLTCSLATLDAQGDRSWKHEPVRRLGLTVTGQPTRLRRRSGEHRQSFWRCRDFS